MTGITGTAAWHSIELTLSYAISHTCKDLATASFICSDIEKHGRLSTTTHICSTEIHGIYTDEANRSWARGLQRAGWGHLVSLLSPLGQTSLSAKGKDAQPEHKRKRNVSFSSMFTLEPDTPNQNETISPLANPDLRYI